MDALELVAQKRLAEAAPIFFRALDMILEQKILVMRKPIGELVCESATEKIEEANRMRQGRTVLIRRRIRKGKLQRNIRRSAVRGFTLRRGKITRIPVSKRIHMRIVQKRASRKRKAHLQMSLRKRKLSLRKRKALGIK